MPTTALLLIDVQESFRHRPYWQDAGLPPFLRHANALVQGCQDAGIPIVRVLHAEHAGGAQNPFAPASGHVVPLQGLSDFDPALTLEKGRHSALVGTPLSTWLRERGIGRLMIAGIRTEQCCETTTRHAFDEGFEVDFVSEATLTFDMQTLDGTPLPARDIVRRTEAVLQGRFATVCTVAQAVSRARPLQAA